MTREPGPAPGSTSDPDATPGTSAGSSGDRQATPGTGDGDASSETGSRRGHPVRWTLLGVLAALLAAVAWLGIRGLLAANELRALPGEATTISQQLQEQDFDGAAATARTIAGHARTAAGLTSDPIWRGAEVLPWVGPNLAAARVVSHELDRIGTAGLEPIAAEAGPLLDSLDPVDGRLELAPLAAVAPHLRDTVEALDSASAALDALEPESLVAPLGDAVEQLGALVAEVRPAASAAADTAALVPPMLGADGPRSILLVFQNNAELRTAGGLAGSFALLDVDDGAISIDTQAGTADFGYAASGGVRFPASTIELFGENADRFMQNATMSPDFAQTAKLLSGYWHERFGTTPDAVVAVDPVVVAGLLSAIGPVAVPDGPTLTGDAAVEQLLVDPYFELETDAEQNAFFAAATSAVFDALLHAHPDPAALLQTAKDSIEAGRVSVWSSHPAEQRMLATTLLAGPAGRLSLAGDDAFGVWLNDATAGKMDSFLDVWMATAAVAGCRPDGRAEVVVEVSLANTAPADAAEQFPYRFMGEGLAGVPLGSIATDVAVAAPPGTFFGSVERDGAPVLTNQLEEAGFPTALARVTIAPGERSTLAFRFVAAQPGPLDPHLIHTPLMAGPEIGDTSADCG